MLKLFTCSQARCGLLCDWWLYIEFKSVGSFESIRQIESLYVIAKCILCALSGYATKPHCDKTTLRQKPTTLRNDVKRCNPVSLFRMMNSAVILL